MGCWSRLGARIRAVHIGSAVTLRIKGGILAGRNGRGKRKNAMRYGSVCNGLGSSAEGRYEKDRLRHLCAGYWAWEARIAYGGADNAKKKSVGVSCQC